MLDKLYKIAYYLILTFLVLIAGLLIISLFPIKNNFQIKIVQSGSMEPAIKTGSIVIIKPSSEYKIGEVITFGEDTKKVSPTTHRITEMRALEGKIYFKTKGDANTSDDINEIPFDKVIGKVKFSVPYLGYIISFAKKPLGFAIIIGIPAIAVVFDEVTKILAEIKKLRIKKQSSQQSDDDEDSKKE